MSESADKGAVGRTASGHFLPGNSDGRQFELGNTERVTHGAFRSVDRPELRTLIETELSAVIEAVGGEPEITPQLRAVAESFARQRVLADAALTQILDGGLVTAKGRTRAIVKVWAQLDDAVVRRAQLLGLERRAKKVPHPADWMDGKAS